MTAESHEHALSHLRGHSFPSDCRPDGCRLIPGDRVLLVTDSQRDLLIVHPPAALDDLLAQRHTEVLGGDPS